MPSNAVLKVIGALKMPKYRQKYSQFTVEGRKSVHEVIHSDYEIQTILATPEFADANPEFADFEIISANDYKKISNFDTPPGIMAVAKTKQFDISKFDLGCGISLVLDGISDPGNLGTMIRTADWYGIHQMILSPDCTDFYNPKALSASMGSFTRCKFLYTDLTQFLAGKFSLGCFLDGDSVHALAFQDPAFVVIGSESRGIRPEVAALIKQKITIPGAGNTESLNASIAAAVVLDNLFRIQHAKR